MHCNKSVQDLQLRLRSCRQVAVRSSGTDRIGNGRQDQDKARQNGMNWGSEGQDRIKQDNVGWGGTRAKGQARQGRRGKAGQGQMAVEGGRDEHARTMQGSAAQGRTFALSRALGCSTVAASPIAKMVPLLPFTHRYSSVTIDLPYVPVDKIPTSKTSTRTNNAMLAQQTYQHDC